ncbi:unnamed protein product [Adineta ricciae]|uniref:G domain-containing protein n=1 Tax=Adineta ricciae TaxID=249248 RepID=A0A815IJ19_ADIRI|nr:unnamed protein product [Adineta ricciae]
MLISLISASNLVQNKSLQTTTIMAELLVKHNFVSKKLKYKPCAVIMGRTGAGKTTLVNALCGTDHKSGAGAGSVTRELYRNDVVHGQHTFSIIDTPGTNSSSETYKHAFLLRQALTSVKINTIFIVTKYDCRFDTMLENCYEVERPVFDYEQKIVVIVSHWDQSKEPEKDYPQICALFEDYCSSIIFYSDKMPIDQLVESMYTFLSNMVAEQITITDEEFFLKFNVAEIKLQIKDSVNQYRKKADAVFTEYSNLVVSAKSQPKEEQDEILHVVIVEFKNEMESLLQTFRNTRGGRMQELDYYTLYIKLEGENLKRCDEFVEKVVPLMSYNLFDNKDPRNLIKRCPHCELIWFKTEGCDGVTSCGNKDFTHSFNSSGKLHWKYILQRIGGKLRLVKQPDIWRASVPKKFDDSVLCTPYTKSKGVGCGKMFTWSELPKVEDELILELFRVKTVEQAKQLIEAGHFKEVRQNYEKSIDTTFHS